VENGKSERMGKKPGEVEPIYELTNDGGFGKSLKMPNGHRGRRKTGC